MYLHNSFTCCTMPITILYPISLIIPESTLAKWKSIYSSIFSIYSLVVSTDLAPIFSYHYLDTKSILSIGQSSIHSLNQLQDFKRDSWEIGYPYFCVRPFLPTNKMPFTGVFSRNRSLPFCTISDCSDLSQPWVMFPNMYAKYAWYVLNAH